MKDKKHSNEFNYFIKADLTRYKGSYIAIVGNKVVAHGDSAKEVWGRARQKYPDKTPTLAKLPKEEALILIW